MKKEQIKSSILRNAVNKLVREYSPEKVILFGSRARGKADRDSDIDLLIIKTTKEPFLDRWMAVREILSDPERMIPIEPIVMTPDEVSQRLAGGDQFLMTILEEGTVLYAA